MADPTNNNLRSRLTRGTPLAVLVAAGVYVGLLIAYQLLPVIELVAVSLLTALILRTVAKGLGRLGVPPWTMPIILLVGLGAFGAFVWLVVVRNVIHESRELISLAPSYIDSLVNLASNVSFIPNPPELAAGLQDLLWQIANSLPLYITNAASLLGAATAALLLAIYMAISPEPLISGALRLVPTGMHKEARELLQVIALRLRGWMVGMLLVSLFIGGGGGVGLWLLGVPLALTFGLIAGLLTVVPYLGSIVGALLPTLMALTISPVKAVEVMVLFVVLNQLEGHVLQPLVMGRSIRLHPAMVLISFLVMGGLLGIVGVLLAVPAAVVFVTLLDKIGYNGPTEEEAPPFDTPAADSREPP